ncbi:MAG TPA: MaoC/PaaZ C-terminal domain-containing protein [Dehalococcoidia bacterium]|jgi:acyl dehydratase|nr:MaoC/PaaZ C-terminal domain-containing protein [Dehalococcoidia bacterium]
MTDLTYDAIEVGKEFGPWKYPLKERIARHLEAVENAHPWHHERSPWGPPVAPPALLGNAAMRFLDTIAPVPPGTLHAKHEIETAAALRLDRQPIAYGRFADRYERRGRKWFVFETRWRDETGLLIGHSTLTMAFAKEPGDRSQEPEGEKSEVRGQKSAEALKRKGELAPVVRTLTAERMTAYSEDSANALRGTSIHVQAEAAKKAGFETTVAQGLMSADYISEMMTAVMGKEWFEDAKLSLAFLSPVLAGEKLTANGRLAQAVKEGAIIRRVYEVWCENERGEAVTAGTATALARRE